MFEFAGFHVPSFRIDTPSVSLNVFDVIGQDGEQPGFISHTGLAENEGSQETQQIKILDMGPPLHGPSYTTTINASALGRAELSDDETRKIRIFIDQHASEHHAFQQLNERQVLRLASEMYCIYPHAAPLLEHDGRYTRIRFSCSGFVFEAYRSAGINLLNPDALPLIDMAVIKMAYPLEARLMESARVTPDSLGLRGIGPWPVLLCGYLLHALNRSATSIRDRAYTPITKDQRFTAEDAGA